MFAALGKAASIEYIDMPEAIRDRYQYFTESDAQGLRRAGYTNLFTPLEQAVASYVTQFLNRADRYR
jgi:ADP-L-glycero-D-manno-heptose 6-epimerase